MRSNQQHKEKPPRGFGSFVRREGAQPVILGLLVRRERSVRLACVLIFCLIFPVLLGGCGSGWVQDHDVHQDQIRAATQGEERNSRRDL